MDRLDELAVRERLGLLAFVALSALYWLVTVLLAHRKLMWNDELYTYYIAILPSLRDIWGALRSGAEQTPLLNYLATRLSLELFGPGNVAFRLPAMLGFWIMMISVFVFVARRTSYMAGAAAAAFPLITDAYKYAFEGRAYGLMLGFAGLALLSWQSLSRDRRRPLWTVLLAASVAAALCTHYYAIFILVPLAIGEAVRSATSRRVSPALWAALLAALAPLALHLPLIRAGQQNRGTFWSPPQWVNVPDFYSDLLTRGMTVVAVILVLVLLDLLMRPRHELDRPRAAPRSPPLAEVIAACGFALIPVGCVILAKVATGAFTGRYALTAIVGLAVLAGLVTAELFRIRPSLRLLTLTGLVSWFALTQAREFIEPTAASQPVGRAAIERPAEWLKSAPNGNLPVVIADPHTFTVLSHYTDPALKARIVYLAHPDLSLKWLGHNSVERGMQQLLGPWFHMNVVDFEPFLAGHSQFLVYGDFFRLAFLNWIGSELRERGWHLELLNFEGDNLLLLATSRAAAATVSAAPDPISHR
jgi:hypothetical protein